MHLVLWLLFAFLIRAQEGNGLDPHGGVQAGKIARGRVGKAGGGLIDPNGVRAQGDEGIAIDPFGRTSAQGDKGFGVDPNG